MFYLLFYFFIIISMVLFFMVYKFYMIYNLIILEINVFMMGVLDYKLYFYVDYMSVMFLIVICVITSMAFLYSKSYMGSEKNINLFLILTFMFVVSMVLLVLSLNFWLILLGWDGLGVVSFFLVIFYYSENSNYSGMITMMINRLGDVGMILSLFFLLSFGSLDFMLLKKFESLMNLFIIFMLLGCFTKSAQFPFSSWLPLAMAAPTPISALVHSSTLVTAGVYLMVRLNVFKDLDLGLSFMILLLSVMTMLMAGCCASVELDIKKIIALSTLSQLAVMMMIVMVGGEIMSFFHILSHALFKALLFLCSGIFIHETVGNQDIRSFPFISNFNYLVVSVFLICSVSLMGFPFLSGFYSKDLILDYFYSSNLNLFVFILVFVSFVFTSIYSLRMIKMSLMVCGKCCSFIYLKNWDLMYSSLMLGVLWVMILGAMLSWLLVDKMMFIYLTYSVKMLTLFILVLGVFCMNISFSNNASLGVLLSMVYLTSYMGMVVNFICLRYMFYSSYTEFYLEKNLNFCIMRSLTGLNLYLSFIKCFSWWMFFYIMLVMIILYLM